MDAMKFHYLAQPAKRYTFEMPKVKSLVEGYCVGNVLNLFAGKVVLNNVRYETRVDSDPTMAADYVMDANEFVKYYRDKILVPISAAIPAKFDTVVLDPPYTWRKAKEMYNGNMIGQYPLLKNDLLDIITTNAIVISLGWDTVGMSKSRGFQKIAVGIVCHGGDHRDTLILVERRMPRLYDR